MVHYKFTNTAFQASLFLSTFLYPSFYKWPSSRSFCLHFLQCLLLITLFLLKSSIVLQPSKNHDHFANATSSSSPCSFFGCLSGFFFPPANKTIRKRPQRE